MNPESRLMRWRTTANAVWAVIGILLLVAVAGWVLSQVSGALVPFVIAFVFVFLAQGAVAALERRGLSRAWAVIACFVSGFVLFSIVAVFLLPPVGRQVVEFADTVSRYVQQGESLVLNLQTRFSDLVVPDWLRATVESVAQSLSDIVVRLGRGMAEGILSAGSGLATSVFNLFLALVVAFWTLKDLPKIREELTTLAGEKYEADLENLLGTVTHVVGGYLKGQTIVSLVTGALAGIGFAVLGVPFALVLAIIVVILNYVPYIGPLFSGLLAGVVGFFVSPLVGLLAVAVVIAAQQVTDLLVTPRVMSEQVDLHPTLVVFSLLVGGSLFGLAGMIFAIPVAATVKGLFVYYYERRTDRSLASEDGALFRTTQCDETDATAACDDESDLDSENATGTPDPAKRST